MPKRGLDVTSCEIFRFYKLITTKGLIEPISMIVPRRVRVVWPSAREAGTPPAEDGPWDLEPGAHAPWGSSKKADGHSSRERPFLLSVQWGWELRVLSPPHLCP